MLVLRMLTEASTRAALLQAACAAGACEAELDAAISAGQRYLPVKVDPTLLRAAARLTVCQSFPPSIGDKCYSSPVNNLSPSTPVCQTTAAITGCGPGTRSRRIALPG